MTSEMDIGAKESFASRVTADSGQPSAALLQRISELEDNTIDLGFKYSTACQELQEARGRISMLEAVVCSTESDNKSTILERDKLASQLDSFQQTNAQTISDLTFKHKQESDEFIAQICQLKADFAKNIETHTRQLQTATDLDQRDAEIKSLQLALKESQEKLESVRALQVLDNSADKSRDGQCSKECTDKCKRLMDEIAVLSQRPTTHDFTTKVAEIQTLKAQMDILTEEADDVEKLHRSRILAAENAFADLNTRSQLEITHLSSQIDAYVSKNDDLTSTVNTMHDQLGLVSKQATESEERAQRVETHYQALLKKSQLYDFEIVELATGKDAIEKKLLSEQESHNTLVARLRDDISTSKAEIEQLKQQLNTLNHSLSTQSSQATISANQLAQALDELDCTKRMLEDVQSDNATKYAALEKLHFDTVQSNLEESQNLISEKALLDTRIQIMKTEFDTVVTNRDAMTSHIASLETNLLNVTTAEKCALDDLAKARTSIDTQMAHIETLEAEHKDLSSRVQKQQSKIDEINQKACSDMDNIKLSVLQMQDDMTALQLRLTETTSEKDTLTAYIAELEGKIAKGNTMEDTAVEKLAQTLGELEHTRELLEEQKSNAAEKIAIVEELHNKAASQTSDLLEQMAGIMSDKAITDAHIESITAELESTKFHYTRIKNELALVQANMDALTTKHAAQKADTTVLVNQKDSLTKEIESLKNQLEVSLESLAQLQSAYTAVLNTPMSSETAQKLEQSMQHISELESILSSKSNRVDQLETLLILLRDDPATVSAKISCWTSKLTDTVLNSMDTISSTCPVYQCAIEISANICELKTTLDSIHQEHDSALMEIQTKLDQSIHHHDTLKKTHEEAAIEFSEQNTLSLKLIEKLQSRQEDDGILFEDAQKKLADLQAEHASCTVFIEDLQNQTKLKDEALASFKSMLLSTLSESDFATLSAFTEYSVEFFTTITNILQKMFTESHNGPHFAEQSQNIKEQQETISKLYMHISELEKCEAATKTDLENTQNGIAALKQQFDETELILEQNRDELQEKTNQLLERDKTTTLLQTALDTALVKTNELESINTVLENKVLEKDNDAALTVALDKLATANVKICDLETQSEKAELRLREVLANEELLLERTATSDLALEDLQSTIKNLEADFNVQIQELSADIEAKADLIAQFTTALQLAQESIEENDVTTEASKKLVKSLNDTLESRDQLVSELNDKLESVQLLLKESQIRADTLYQENVAMLSLQEQQAFDATTAKHSIDQLEQQISKLQADLQSGSDQVQALQQELAILQQHTAITKQSTEVQCDIIDWDQSQEAVLQSESYKNEMEKQLLIVSSLQEKIQHLDKELQSMTSVHAAQDEKFALEISTMTVEYKQCITDLEAAKEESKQQKLTLEDANQKLSKLEDKVQQSESELDLSKSLIERANEDLAKRDAQELLLKSEHARMSAELNTIKNQLNDTSDEKEKLVQELTVQLESNQKQLSSTILLLENAKSELACMKLEHAVKVTENTTLCKENMALEKQIQASTSQCLVYEQNAAKTRAQCDQLQSEIKQHLEKLGFNSEALAKQNSQINELNQALDQSTKLIVSLRDKSKSQAKELSIETTHTSTDEKVKELEQQLNTLKEQYNELERAHQTLSDESAGRVSTICTLKNQILRLETRCSLFKAHLKQVSNVSSSSDASLTVSGTTTDTLTRKRIRPGVDAGLTRFNTTVDESRAAIAAEAHSQPGIKPNFSQPQSSSTDADDSHSPKKYKTTFS
ncbi:hypothetical protein O5D80_000739 [Batrachochytrium dendrobatidis]|nr:hypothetical protein O5D80_000739 [Batrachochytrium dendrobatidis]